MTNSLQAPIPVPEIDYRLVLNTVGWATCEVAIGSSSVTITASYLGHALKELVEAACLIMSGETCSEAHFWEEPGEYRWVIDRTGESCRVRIIEFGGLWSNDPIEAGTVLIDEICDIAVFGNAVLRAADRVLDEHGLAGYAAIWGQGEFPIGSVGRLRELVQTSI